MKVLSWPGAKWRIGPEIIEQFPKHNIYLEPFLGSGAIFFQKKPVNLEILNDLDGDIVNLFKVIRDSPESLAKDIFLTPYSRQEYEESYDRKGLTGVERARKFIIRTNMARAAMQYYSSSWRQAGPIQGSKSYKHVVSSWNRLPEQILKAAIRLKDAEIECTNAIDLIKKYNQDDCLIYADPPYLLSTRRQRYYNEEMEYEDEHLELLKVLKEHSGPVILSGYETDLYNNELPGWNKKYIDAVAEQGKARIEVIWTNFEMNNQISMKELLI